MAFSFSVSSAPPAQSVGGSFTPPCNVSSSLVDGDPNDLRLGETHPPERPLTEHNRPANPRCSRARDSRIRLSTAIRTICVSARRIHLTAHRQAGRCLLPKGIHDVRIPTPLPHPRFAITDLAPGERSPARPPGSRRGRPILRLLTDTPSARPAPSAYRDEIRARTGRRRN